MDSAQSVPASPVTSKINEFLDYLQVERNASPLTIRNYKHYLNRFSSWFGDKEIEEIDQASITKYRLFLSELSDKKGGVLRKKTQGYHVIALRSFLKWLIKHNIPVVAPEKIDLPKIEDRQVKFLTPEQVDRLLNSPTQSSIQGKRDKAILETLFSTGLRVSELVRLDRDKIDFERREFGIVGKGGRARVVFLSRRAIDWINIYLRAREDHFKPLFIRHKGNFDATTPDSKVRLTVRSIQRLVRKYARKVKLPVEATPHILRHSFATDLLVAGADIRSVQEMLGHKNISTTQIYTHVTHKQLKDIHENFHGKGK